MDNLDHQLIRQRQTARTFFWHRIRWGVLFSQLKQHQVHSIVDVGAGSGIFADFVKRGFPEATYYFVEPSETMSTILRKEFGQSQDLTQATNYHQADAVILLDVLEHIDQDEPFLKDLLDKMRPGAVLAMTVPSMMSLWSGWDILVGHRRRYERKNLLGLFAKFKDDFVVEECRFLFWELYPLGLHRKRKLRVESVHEVDPLKESEVPELSPILNKLLYIFSRTCLAVSRWMPFGTSLILVGTKKNKNSH